MCADGFKECDQRRRADDHLSLVAGIRRQQRDQFEAWNAETMAKLAALPIPLNERPKHGSKAGYERVREQARVQVEGRTEKKLKHELLLPVAEGMGFAVAGAFGGRCVRGFGRRPVCGGARTAIPVWFCVSKRGRRVDLRKEVGIDREEEKKGFEWLVDEITQRRAANPKMHVYHFGAYEPGALKRLMGMYGTAGRRNRPIAARGGPSRSASSLQARNAGQRGKKYSLKKVEAFTDSSGRHSWRHPGERGGTWSTAGTGVGKRRDARVGARGDGGYNSGGTAFRRRS